ncbi:MAG TPA: cupin domain-containing protein [Limnochordia bacterium]|nr:cupin domain-containing protein [Limnochordia bacterium]
MIRRSEERNVAVRENMRGGQGSVQMCHLLNGAAEMYEKGRLFAHFTLEPGCSIGYHVHEGEAEAYYFLTGTGEYNDNGVITTVQAGDVAVAWDGEGHGIKNIGTGPLEFIALILYK